MDLGQFDCFVPTTKGGGVSIKNKCFLFSILTLHECKFCLTRSSSIGRPDCHNIEGIKKKEAPKVDVSERTQIGGFYLIFATPVLQLITYRSLFQPPPCDINQINGTKEGHLRQGQSSARSASGCPNPRLSGRSRTRPLTVGQIPRCLHQTPGAGDGYADVGVGAGGIHPLRCSYGVLVLDERTFVSLSLRVMA